MAAGGTGLTVVKGIVDYFSQNNWEVKNLILICRFKSPSDILYKDELKYWKCKINLLVTVDKEMINTLVI